MISYALLDTPGEEAHGRKTFGRRLDSMSTEIRKSLTEYYRDEGIHPNHFTCKNQTICRRHAHQEFMTETKMSMV